MRDTDAVKWALVDLLKLLDQIYGGDIIIHDELARIARTLGVELPVPPLELRNDEEADSEGLA